MNQPPASAGARAGDYIVHSQGMTHNGLSAREVAEMLESAAHVDAKVYKIRAALPDGRLELIGVAADRFRLEDAFLFYRSTAAAARDDFLALARLADRSPPPCRAVLQLATLAARPHANVVALLYPAEYADEMSAWLSAAGFAGGDFVEGGVSHATDYHAAEKMVAQRHQLWGTADGTRADDAAPGREARRA
ncbi:MAG: hypothetical protein U1A27_09185 [Phycisphaerae bacterium]